MGEASRCRRGVTRRVRRVPGPVLDVEDDVVGPFPERRLEGTDGLGGAHGEGRGPVLAVDEHPDRQGVDPRAHVGVDRADGRGAAGEVVAGRLHDRGGGRGGVDGERVRLDDARSRPRRRREPSARGRRRRGRRRPRGGRWPGASGVNRTVTSTPSTNAAKAVDVDAAAVVVVGHDEGRRCGADEVPGHRARRPPSWAARCPPRRPPRPRRGSRRCRREPPGATRSRR